jgi:hypothetical protein
MNKRGFIIIECLVYCALAVWLLTEVLGFVVATSNLTQRALQQSNHCFATHCALQNFARDVANGSGRILVSPTSFVITSDKQDKGWVFENKTWRRIRGTYDATQKVWIKRHTTTMLDHVVSVTMQHKSHGIEVALTTDYLQLTRYVPCQ